MWVIRLTDACTWCIQQCNAFVYVSSMFWAIFGHIFSVTFIEVCPMYYSLPHVIKILSEWALYPPMSQAMRSSIGRKLSQIRIWIPPVCLKRSRKQKAWRGQLQWLLFSYITSLWTAHVILTFLLFPEQKKHSDRHCSSFTMAQQAPLNWGTNGQFNKERWPPANEVGRQQIIVPSLQDCNQSMNRSIQ